MDIKIYTGEDNISFEARKRYFQLEKAYILDSAMSAEDKTAAIVALRAKCTLNANDEPTDSTILASFTLSDAQITFYQTICMLDFRELFQVKDTALPVIGKRLKLRQFLYGLLDVKNFLVEYNKLIDEDSNVYTPANILTAYNQVNGLINNIAAQGINITTYIDITE